MSLLTLVCHPKTPCSAIRSIHVSIIDRGEGALMLRYILNGDVTKVRLPAMRRPERTDELWQHTCFEAFVKAVGNDRYWEFNFAPSSQWAAYAFDTYRAGMRPFEAVKPPRILAKSTDGEWELQVLLDLTALPHSRDTALQIGFSAVIEETDGAKSYWALAHAPEKPDFHHADSFVHDLTLTDPS